MWYFYVLIFDLFSFSVNNHSILFMVIIKNRCLPVHITTRNKQRPTPIVWLTDQSVLLSTIKKIFLEILKKKKSLFKKKLSLQRTLHYPHPGYFSLGNYLACWQCKCLREKYTSLYCECEINFWSEWSSSNFIFKCRDIYRYTSLFLLTDLFRLLIGYRFANIVR